MKLLRAAALAVLVTAAAVSAPALPAVPAATTIDALTATPSANGLTVSGVVTYGGEAEVRVATDRRNDWANDDPDLGPLGGPLGIDVVELAIHRYDPNADEVEFVIKVAELNVPPPNEVIRYLWLFRADGTVYWIQAKTSDIASVNLPEDPEGAVSRLEGAFRLRGSCATTVVSSCAHLKWIDGSFDVDANEIRMVVPLGDPVAPHIAEGAVIVGDGMTASVQAVGSNAMTSDNVGFSGVYTIAERAAMLGIAPIGTSPGDVTFDIAPTVRLDGFDAEVDISGLASGDYALFARACFGANCAVSSVPFSV